MPRSAGYEPVLFSQPASTLIDLPRSKREAVLRLVNRLAEQPGQLGDYSTRDVHGREIQHLKLGGWNVSFWADHAVRELRVVEIVEF